jgi:hypothetical protein
MAKRLKKALPATWRTISERRFSLPEYLAPEYVQQDLDQEEMFTRLIWQRTGLSGFHSSAIPSEDYKAMVGNVVPISRWVRCGTPVYFLERAMGDAFLRTRLLTDLDAQDLHWRFPAFKLYLPSGLVRIQGTQDSVWTVLISLVRGSDCGELLLPMALEREFERFFRKQGADAYYQALRQQWRDDHIRMIYTHGPARDSRETNAKILHCGLDEFALADISGKVNINTDLPEAYVDVFSKVHHLALMTLLYWNQAPEERVVSPSEAGVVSNAKHSVRSGLWEPRWVGEKSVFTNQSKEELAPKGGHHRAHWVCGHLKRQAYGPGFSARKIIWVMPYETS